MKKRIFALSLSLVCLFTASCSKPKDASTSSDVSSLPESSVLDSSSSQEQKSSSSAPAQKSRVETIIDGMTLREQVEQLFMVSLKGYGEDTEAAKTFFESACPGGYVLFAQNISTVQGTKALSDAATAGSKLAPFIGIDEEGGSISRLTAGGLPGYVNVPTAAKIGATGDTTAAYAAGKDIGKVLKTIGVNVDFAPDADVLTNPNNTVIGNRSFGSDPALVADMVASFSRGLREQDIMTAPKHFPGHGGTAGDSHDGFVSVDYDAAHFAAVEYLPFIRAIDEGAEFVLVGHITAPNADPSGLPASLSRYFLTEILRGQLGFEGIIITDAMDMGAIANNYTSAQSAVMAINAGVDIVLMPKDYEQAVEGILNAVSTGEITTARIQESLTRILQTKIDAGIIQ